MTGTPLTPVVQHLLQMALKRRSLSTLSNVSSTSDKCTPYRHLTDLSPDRPPSGALPPAIATDPPKRRMFLKKANVYRLIRKKTKQSELKPAVSTNSLFEEVSGREVAAVPEPQPSTCKGAFDAAVQCVYVSFSFGKDRYLRRQNANRKLLESNKYAYRCVAFSSDWTAGTDWSLVGYSEMLVLTGEEHQLKVTFVTPFEVRYDYDADTTLRFELQRARLSTKSLSGTFNTLDKVRRAAPIDANHNTETPGGPLKFICIASASADLNGLVHRKTAQLAMNMRSELGPDCTIHLASESLEARCRSTPAAPLNLRLFLEQRVDENRERTFSELLSYRLLVSRSLEESKSFVPVFKSAPFQLVHNGEHFLAHFERVPLSLPAHPHIFVRVALIEGFSERCLCFGDFVSADLAGTDQQHQYEFPIIEAPTPPLPANPSNTSAPVNAKIGFAKVSNPPRPDTMDFSMRVSVANAPSLSCSPPSSSNLFTRSFSLSEKDRNTTKSTTLTYSESQRSSCASSRNSFQREERESKKEILDDDDDDTIIVNGHTQAYIMSLLKPNRRILVREVFPDREVICEQRY